MRSYKDVANYARYLGLFLTLSTIVLTGCAEYESSGGWQSTATAPTTIPRSNYSYYDSHREATVLDAVLVNAIAQIGKPYVWGGESRHHGFDCSGLIQYVLNEAGVTVPRTARAQALALPAVSFSRIRKGDLVFFDTMGAPYTHVGIYIGGDQFVSALNRHAGITVQSLHNPYWAQRLDGIRRPMPPELLAMQSLDDHVLNQ
ncbi:C40 family peptidase [Acidithiobacillus sp. IBUN Pt1247-S3]|uniref:C40 family peptidase n=1 Tax=Acidithiobacillus sp. IBUN Pt1247-S3 TaxID=3166642 RepID=UPI0034E4CAD1